MLKFTYHALKRAKERGLSLDAIADWIFRQHPALPERKIRIPMGDMTIVAKREGKELVVITAWLNEERVEK